MTDSHSKLQAPTWKMHIQLFLLIFPSFRWLFKLLNDAEDISDKETTAPLNLSKSLFFCISLKMQQIAELIWNVIVPFDGAVTSWASSKMCTWSESAVHEDLKIAECENGTWNFLLNPDQQSRRSVPSHPPVSIPRPITCKQAARDQNNQQTTID